MDFQTAYIYIYIYIFFFILWKVFDKCSASLLESQTRLFFSVVSSYVYTLGQAFVEHTHPFFIDFQKVIHKWCQPNEDHWLLLHLGEDGAVYSPNLFLLQLLAKTQCLLEGSKELPGILCLLLCQHLQQFSAQQAHNAYSLPTDSIQKIGRSKKWFFFFFFFKSNHLCSVPGQDLKKTF